MNEIKVSLEDAGKRLDTWIVEKLSEYSRNYIQKLIIDGNIRVNEKKEKNGYKICNGDVINVYIPMISKLDVIAEDIKVPILYEDEYILVINKPKGMVVHPACGNQTGTLVNSILHMCEGRLSDINGVVRPGIVHRIDKDTSGVLVVAKTNQAHERLSDMLKRHDINRIYIALVEGIIREEQAQINAPIGRHPVDRKKMAVNTQNGKNAITHFKVIDRFRDDTLIEARLETGRTHQIRVHLSYIGHPLVGDMVYGKKTPKYNFIGQALHAKLLGFKHPISGEYMEFSAEIPDEFNAILSEISLQR